MDWPLGSTSSVSCPFCCELQHVLPALHCVWQLEPGEPFTLKDARKLYSGALIGNCGYTQETAEAAIAAGDADMIAFGRPYISNPDLVERFTNGWPLADAPDMSVWYGGGAAGYTDFPVYKA
jgi:N-ethylmaleimide reductase